MEHPGQFCVGITFKSGSIFVRHEQCRRQLVDLSDDMATKIDIQFYSDARDALLKAMAE